MWRRRLLLVMGIASCLTRPAGALHPAAGSNNEFCFAMLDRLSAGKENVAFSPVTVWSLLTLMAAGAENETRAQMYKALVLGGMLPAPPPAPNATEKAYGLPAGDANSFTAEWLDAMKRTKGVQMKVESRIWGTKGLAFRPDFLSLAAKSYGTGHDTLDFSGDAKGAVQSINQWAADSTRGRIKELPGSATIRPDSQIILTSTFCFDGKWMSPFDARSTVKRDFTLAGGRKVQADTLSGTAAAGYIDDERLQAVRLRFQGMEASMILVLPKKAEALSGPPFLNMQDFMLLLAMMKDEPRVAVQMPKFIMPGPVEFSAALKAAGMTRAFAGDAQFGRACGQQAAISTVVHQAAMGITESGVGAAVEPAAAPVAAPKTDGPLKSFIADHPFLFFIVDEAFSGVVLAGRLGDPSM